MIITHTRPRKRYHSRIYAVTETPEKGEEEEGSELDVEGVLTLKQPHKGNTIPALARVEEARWCPIMLAMVTIAADRKTASWGRKHHRHEPEENDGQLMVNLKVLPTICDILP
jgi:hypothetical protein